MRYKFVRAPLCAEAALHMYGRVHLAQILGVTFAIASMVRRAPA